MFVVFCNAVDEMKKTPEDGYALWKTLVPALYDWLTSHHLMWPSLSCRWGPQIEVGPARNRQLLFYSERTDGECPNTIVVVQCDIMKPRTASAEQISQKFKDGGKSPYLKKLKTIIHPGEVNRIRELPQNSNILATHTDSPEVLIWNTISQPNRASTSGASESRPDLVLKGHSDNAEFALNLGRTAPYVISGGRDHCVLLWSIEDHITSLQEQTPRSGTPTVGGSKISGAAGATTDLFPRGIFKGHFNTVEDVQFRPSSMNEFCSVGDDSCLLLWDARAGYAPISKVEKAHDADLHCVDWNAHDENLLLTGSADYTVRLFDHRKITGSGQALPVERFEGHSAAVLCVQWCPDSASVFGSCAEDGFLNVWDFEKVGKTLDTRKVKHTENIPPGLFFRHTGHRDKVVDFHWDLCDPWTIASLSEDANTPGGGGTLQIWRMTDLIYRPEEQVLAELEVVRPQLVSQRATAI